MFSLNFRKTGWLARYLIFRASTPFSGPEPYLEFTGEENLMNYSIWKLKKMGCS